MGCGSVLSQTQLVKCTCQPVCIGCELTERNDPTPEERARRKAYNTINHHAEKRGMTPTDFAKRYDWNIERMVYDITHGHENTCAYCWERYERMGHGLSDITLDVIDRDREPYYRTNTRWCCQTCNREKSSLPPWRWERRLIVWPLYMRWREKMSEDHTHGLPLFANALLPPPIVFGGGCINRGRKDHERHEQTPTARHGNAHAAAAAEPRAEFGRATYARKLSVAQRHLIRWMVPGSGSGSTKAPARADGGK
jgi:hypothetical protein